MVNEEFKGLFITESKEHIDNLNNLLVKLEKDSKDTEIINDTFRNFHTLKGNSATMGYEKFSRLAHKLEDLLDLLRNNKLEVNSDIMDILFIGCDTLTEGLESIQKDSPENFDDTDIIKKLEGINPTQKEAKQEEIITDEVVFSEEEEKQIKEKSIDKESLKRIIITFEDSPLKSIKALTVIKKLCDNGHLVRINPSKKEIEGKKFNNHIEIICSIENKEKIQEIISKISKIEDYKILSINDSYESHKKEENKGKIIQKHNEDLNKIQEVKIDIKRLDNLMNMVGELLIHNMRLENINKDIHSNDLEELIAAIGLLTQNIQNEVIEERMIPLQNVFSRFPRIVRDLSKEEGKEIEFIIEGEENSLDRTVIDKITDPLTHIIRNSIDHGIEIPEMRISNNKPRKGTLKLVAKREKNHVAIEVEDDGAGIDIESVKRNALKKGLMNPEKIEGMSDLEIQQLIFLPGLSTNDKITEISGRGVGMDVVETNIKQAKGKVFLESKKGKGTKIRIELPLTMAIINVLIVIVNNEKYAVPLTNIHKVLTLKSKNIKTIQNRETFILRDEDIPLLRLEELIGLEKKEKDILTLIVVENNDNQKIGIVVDSIFEQQQILIKNIDNQIKKTKGISGATILGDGNVCFILDIDSLIE